ncbi:MAG: NAD-dependent epimerase/dehydratase family protein, partial [Candidatus Micrarchaeaceae archaeon]
MKKIIISGGNGFLGSFLVEKALKENMDVTVVDDMSTSKEINVSKDVTFIKKKIEFFDTEENFDFIVHLAARPSPEDYIKHPIDTIL